MTIITAIAFYFAMWLFSASSFHELPKQDDKELKCQKAPHKRVFPCRDMNTFDDHQSTLRTSSEEDPESQIVGSYNRNTCEASCRIKVGPHWYRVLDTIVHCLSVHDDCIRPSTVVIWKPIIF